MDEMEDVIRRKDWEFLVKNFLPVNFVDSLTFTEVMHLVGSLMVASTDEVERGSFLSDVLRDFAVNLMIILRANDPVEWRADWKNEAFLGVACNFVFREAEGFTYIKNAFMGLEDPPQSLIFAYVSAGSGCPRFLTREEAAQLIQKASDKGATCESSQRMVMLAVEMGWKEKEEFWRGKAKELEKKNIHTPIITPDVLKSMYKLQEGYQHEK